MDRLDPARTALLVTHMAKGVAGDVDTPSTDFSGAGPRRKGSSGSRHDCWTGSARPRRRWSTPSSHTSQGCPGSGRTRPCFARSSTVPPFCKALPRSRSLTTSLRGPMNRSSGDRQPTGLTAPHSTSFSAWQASTRSCSSVSPRMLPSNQPRASHLICNTERSSSPTPAKPTAMRPTPARLTCSKNGSPRHPPPTRSSAPWGELPPVHLTELRERELLPSLTFVDRSSG
jgi:hypothetical protein